MFEKFFIKFRIPILFLLVLILVCVPVLSDAVTETMSFDLWSRYSTAITYVDFTGSDYGVVESLNLVDSTSQNSIFVNSQPVGDSLNTPYFRRISIGSSVGSATTQPVFSVSDIFLNRPVSTVVTVRISSGNSPSNIAIIDFQRAYGSVFTSSNNQSPFYGSCELLGINVISKKIFEMSFTCTFNFTDAVSIYGFWFAFDGIFDYNVSSEGDSSSYYYFDTTFSISPLVFTNDLTKFDVEQSVVDGILSATGGNNYTAVDDSTVNNIQDQEDQIIENIEQYKDSSLSSSDFDLDTKLNSSDLTGLKSTLIGLSNLVTNKFINKLPFSTVIYFAIGFGAFGFLFGLATWSVGTITKNNFMRSQRQAARSRIEAARSRSQARTRKGKGG